MGIPAITAYTPTLRNRDSPKLWTLSAVQRTFTKRLISGHSINGPMLGPKTGGLSYMPWTDKNLRPRANPDAKQTPLDVLKPEVFGELAALTVLNIVFAAVGAKTRRRMAKALNQQIADWTRGDPQDDTPTEHALRESARRFGRPAAQSLLSEDVPPPDIDRA